MLGKEIFLQPTTYNLTPSTFSLVQWKQYPPFSVLKAASRAVEERSIQLRSPTVRSSGANRSETVGMSNHMAGENPARRIPKVSHAMSINVGLVGPKARPKGVADGQQVNIPAPCRYRQRKLLESLVGLCLAHPVFRL